MRQVATFLVLAAPVVGVTGDRGSQCQSDLTAEPDRCDISGDRADASLCGCTSSLNAPLPTVAPTGVRPRANVSMVNTSTLHTTSTATSTVAATSSQNRTEATQSVSARVMAMVHSAPDKDRSVTLTSVDFLVGGGILLGGFALLLGVTSCFYAPRPWTEAESPGTAEDNDEGTVSPLKAEDVEDEFRRTVASRLTSRNYRQRDSSASVAISVTSPGGNSIDGKKHRATTALSTTSARRTGSSERRSISTPLL